MASAPFNHTLKLLLNQEVDLTACKLLLLSSSAAFDATDTDIGDVTSSGAYEVSGNGWTAGGETIASLAASVANTDGAKLDGTDISVLASGGAIGPVRYAVVYDSASDKPLFWIDPGVSLQSDAGIPFVMVLDALGLMTVDWE